MLIFFFTTEDAINRLDPISLNYSSGFQPPVASSIQTVWEINYGEGGAKKNIHLILLYLNGKREIDNYRNFMVPLLISSFL